MQYPVLPGRQSSRQMIDTFLGYNHNLRIGDGEFYDMENLTSDHYPVLSPRNRRGIYAEPESPQGLINKDGLCYIDGTDFVIEGLHVDMGLSTDEADCPKQLISMGAYVIIMPDKKWINTIDLTQYGNIEASFSTLSDVTFTLCSLDGSEYEDYTVSSSEPENPENMDLWLDTSGTPHVLKKYSTVSAIWVNIPTTYVKIHSTGIGNAFEFYDGVDISGVNADELQGLNGSHVIWAKDSDYIVVIGLIDSTMSQPAASGAVTVRRSMPIMDYMTESGNRMWGCRYGLNADGEVVNEIYASKLGDFKNWNCFMDLSTDSYYASCGTDGRFTGAITFQGRPLFFKENFLHMVYGNFPANFQIQDTPLRGVQRGSERSLAIVNEILYYKGQNGICAFDGSFPVEVSAVLGTEAYDSAVAGSHGNKYYVSMHNVRTEQWSLFAYDVRKGLWHREDNLHATAFCSSKNDLYCIADGKIIGLLGVGIPEDGSVEWMATTGKIGIYSPDSKYISRLTIRMFLDMDSELQIFGQYDFSGDWESMGAIDGCSHPRSFSLPIRPKRCDYLVLKLVGKGNCKIYSITKTIEQGSEHP